MIARIAPLRIWRLKLAETFLTPSDSASTFCVSVVRQLVLLAPIGSFLRRIWKLLYESEPVSVPRPWIDRVARAGRSPPSAAHLRERDGLRRRERDLDAALEVDPEVEALDDEQQHAESPTATSEMMK